MISNIKKLENLKIITWSKFFGDISELSSEITFRFPHRDFAILAISRGGLIPAVIISHRLNCHDFFIVCINKYNRKKGKIFVSQRFSDRILKFRNIVIIDDLISSGSTFREIMKMFTDKKYRGNLVFSVLYNKSENIEHENLIFVEKIKPEKWIELPFETHK